MSSYFPGVVDVQGAPPRFLDAAARDAGIPSPSDGDMAVTTSDDVLWEYDLGTASWVALGSASATHTHANQAVLDVLTDAGSGAVITASERSGLNDHLNNRFVASKSYFGNSTVATLNGLGSPPATFIGVSVVMTDAGTLTLGSLTVAAGDTVEWDGAAWAMLIANVGGFPPGGTRSPIGAGAPVLPPLVEADKGRVATFGGSSLTPVLSTPVLGQEYEVSPPSVMARSVVVATGTVGIDGDWELPAESPERQFRKSFEVHATRYLGNGTVSVVDALSLASPADDGATAVMSDAGTLTAGSLSVVAGDAVQWQSGAWVLIAHAGLGVPKAFTRMLVEASGGLTLLSPLIDGTDNAKVAVWDGISSSPTLLVPESGWTVLVTSATTVDSTLADAISAFESRVYTATFPSGSWTAPIPASPDIILPQSVYVSVSRGDDATGNGSRAKPYKTITAGIAQAATLTVSGTIRANVLIEPGTYDEAVSITADNIALIGLGSKRTDVLIKATTTPQQRAVEVDAENIHLENLWAQQTATSGAGIWFVPTALMAQTSLTLKNVLGEAFPTGSGRGIYVHHNNNVNDLTLVVRDSKGIGRNQEGVYVVVPATANVDIDGFDGECVSGTGVGFKFSSPDGIGQPPRRLSRIIGISLSATAVEIAAGATGQRRPFVLHGLVAKSDTGQSLQIDGGSPLVVNDATLEGAGSNVYPLVYVRSNADVVFNGPVMKCWSGSWVMRAEASAASRVRLVHPSVVYETGGTNTEVFLVSRLSTLEIVGGYFDVPTAGLTRFFSVQSTGAGQDTASLSIVGGVYKTPDAIPLIHAQSPTWIGQVDLYDVEYDSGGGAWLDQGYGTVLDHGVRLSGAALASVVGGTYTKLMGPPQKLVSVTASKTLGQDERAVEADATAAAIALTLPPASSVPPLGEFQVKRISTNANSVDIAPDGTDTIDGVGSSKTLVALENVVVRSDGVSNWSVV